MLLRICEMLKQVQHDAGSVQHDAEERKEGGTSRMWYRSLFCGTARTGITLIITPFVNCVDTFPLKGQRFLWEF